jgi:hypothetical protein
MRRLSISILATLLLAACGSGAGSPPPEQPSAPPATPSATPAPHPEPSGPIASTPAASPPGPVVPSQSDTEWGRIWDELPDGFPVPPGSTATEPDVPASGAYDVPTSVEEAATFMQQTLELANFSTFTMSGPLEDGSIVIESVGPGGTDCRVETTVKPLGGVTRLTIRYGAACAFG